MSYKHGIFANEKGTVFPQTNSTRYGVQVVFGTAPVHLSRSPYDVTNVPIMASNIEEVTDILGFSEDWEAYTLCQSMYASHSVFKINPVIYINVLDPKVHKKENVAKEYPVVRKQVKVEVAGILRDTVSVSPSGENQEAYADGKDYILSHDIDGNLIITLLSSGAAYEEKLLKVSSVSVAPEMVAEDNIIGSYDLVTGKETGMELIRQIYPRFQVSPGVILAPGWSHHADVAAVMQSKCREINDTFYSECLLDLETEKTKLYTDCADAKKEMGFDSPHGIVLWPMVTVKGKQIYYSAVYGAMMSKLTLDSGDIPYLYPSNKLLQIDGAVLLDGTGIMLDQVQAAALNGDGIVTAINDNGWRSIGNNTAAYPGVTDPKDRWIGCRRMFSFIKNSFSISFKSEIDGVMDKRTINNLVNRFNIWGNSLVSQGACASLSMEYYDSDNSVEAALEGRTYVRIKFAPYTPMEYIEATMEFDVETLRSVLKAQEE